MRQKRPEVAVSPADRMPEPVSANPQSGREPRHPARVERVRPLLREAVVEQYAVFARHFADEAGGDGDPLAPVRAAARHLSDWLGVDLLAEAERQARAAPWPQRGQAAQICLIPYRASPDGTWAGFLHAQARNDTLLIQMAYARPGEADDVIFRHLCHALWLPPAGESHFLGQTRCFGGIAADEACATSWAEEALSLCRNPQVPEPEWAPAGLRCLDLGYAWLFDHPQAPDALALFYPDEAREQEASVRLFNTALLELLPPAHKATHQFRGYEAALRPELAAAESRLAGALRQASPPAPDVHDLERQLKRVARAYEDFARQMSRFEGVQQTVRLNVGNFEAALARHELPARGPLAGLQATVRRTVQQMEADAGYYRSAVEGAGVTLDALQVQAQIERGQVESQRNLIIAFLGVVLAMGQLIANDEARSFLAWLATLFGWTAGPATGAQVFAARLALAVMAGLAGMLIVWGVGKLRRRSGLD